MLKAYSQLVLITPHLILIGVLYVKSPTIIMSSCLFRMRLMLFSVRLLIQTRFVPNTKYLSHPLTGQYFKKRKNRWRSFIDVNTRRDNENGPLYGSCKKIRVNNRLAQDLTCSKEE